MTSALKLFLFASYLLTSPISTVTAKEEEAQVIATVTGGPTECEKSKQLSPDRYAHVFYTGSIDESSDTGEKGFVFESNVGHDETFSFPINAGRVILGWDIGLSGKCVGQNVTLIIPPNYGYGEEGAHEVIPGGATLRFDIEIVDVTNESGPEPDLFAEIDANEDGYLDQEELLDYFRGRGVEGLPPNLMSEEDIDRDGRISWDEFTGPKGPQAPKNEEL